MDKYILAVAMSFICTVVSAAPLTPATLSIDQGTTLTMDGTTVLGESSLMVTVPIHLTEDAPTNPDIARYDILLSTSAGMSGAVALDQTSYLLNATTGVTGAVVPGSSVYALKALVNLALFSSWVSGDRLTAPGYLYLQVRSVGKNGQSNVLSSVERVYVTPNLPFVPLGKTTASKPATYYAQVEKDADWTPLLTIREADPVTSYSDIVAVNSSSLLSSTSAYAAGQVKYDTSSRTLYYKPAPGVVGNDAVQLSAKYAARHDETAMVSVVIQSSSEPPSFVMGPWSAAGSAKISLHDVLKPLQATGGGDTAAFPGPSPDQYFSRGRLVDLVGKPSHIRTIGGGQVITGIEQTAGQFCPFATSQAQAQEKAQSLSNSQGRSFCYVKVPDGDDSIALSSSSILYGNTSVIGSGLILYFNLKTAKAGPYNIEVWSASPQGAISKIANVQLDAELALSPTSTSGVSLRPSYKRISNVLLIKPGSTVATIDLNGADPSAFTITNKSTPASLAFGFDDYNNWSANLVDVDLYANNDCSNPQGGPSYLHKGCETLNSPAIKRVIGVNPGGPNFYINGFSGDSLFGGIRWLNTSYFIPIAGTLERVSSQNSTVTVISTFTESGTLGSVPQSVRDNIIASKDRLRVCATIDLKKAFETYITPVDPDAVPQLLADPEILAASKGCMTVPTFEGAFPPAAGTINPGSGYLWLGPRSTKITLQGADAGFKVVWSVTNPAGEVMQYTTTAGDGLVLPETELVQGVYKVSAVISNGVGDTATAAEVSFHGFVKPVATLLKEDFVVVGQGTIAVKVTTKNVPASTGTVTLKLGDAEYPASLSSDAGVYVGTVPTPAASGSYVIAARIRVDAENFPDAYVDVEADNKTFVTENLMSSLSGVKAWYWRTDNDAISFVGSNYISKATWRLTVNGSTRVIEQSKPQALLISELLEGQYSATVDIYNNLGTKLTAGPFEFRVFNTPVVQLNPISGTLLGGPVKITAAISNVAPTSKVTFRIGDSPYDGVLSEGLVTVDFKAPFTAGSYGVTLDVFPDPDWPQVYKRFDGGRLSVQSLTPTKITMGIQPKYLDIGVAAKLTASSQLGFDKALMPSARLKGQWTLFDGTIVPGLTLTFTPTQADYDLYVAGARMSFSSWVDGYPDTTSTTEVSSVLLPPWVLPDYTLEIKKGSQQIIAPDAVVLRAVPSEPIDSAMYSYRGVQYKWTLPTGDNVASRVVRELASIEISAAGEYPIELEVVDNKGNSKKASFNITAVASTLSFSKLEARLVPDSGREPVTAVMKPTTSSTHKRERVRQWLVYHNGELVSASSLAPRPLTLTGVGEHTIEVKATSNYGNVVSKTTKIMVVPNQKPECDSFKTRFGRNADNTHNVKVSAICKDSDGRIKGYSWTLDGNELTVGKSQSRAFNFAGSQTLKIGVTVLDDSGATTYHEEVIGDALSSSAGRSGYTPAVH